MYKIAISLLLFAAIFTGGCQKANKNEHVRVVIEDGTQFPQFLVGKWKAEHRTAMEIDFTDNGSISSTVISMGLIEVEPGQTTTAPMRKGGKSIIEPGPWLVKYNPANRELTVEIVLDHVYMELGDTALEGDIKDVFAGPVSEDGNSWKVTWTTYTNLTGYIPGQDYTDFSTPDYGYTTELVFNKVF